MSVEKCASKGIHVGRNTGVQLSKKCGQHTDAPRAHRYAENKT